MFSKLLSIPVSDRAESRCGLSHQSSGCSQSLRTSACLCAVTLLQSWFLTLRVQRAVDEQQPVMICADGKLLGSRTVIENMRAISSRHGADPKDVVAHSLKHAALSALGGAGASSVDIATAGGHKTIESSVPYGHPNMDQGRRNSEIFGRKRGLERSDVQVVVNNRVGSGRHTHSELCFSHSGHNYGIPGVRCV
jgi:hypothetical protein